MNLVLKSAVVCGLLGIGACSDVSTESGGPATGSPASEPAAQPVAAGSGSSSPTVPPAPAPRPAEAAAENETVAALPDETARAPAITDPVRSFPELVGKSGVQVRAAMGAPDRVSEQPPARVWHYRLSGCDLELFLFPDVSSGAEKALSWSAEPTEPAGGTEPDPRCAEVAASG